MGTNLKYLLCAGMLKRAVDGNMIMDMTDPSRPVSEVEMANFAGQFAPPPQQMQQGMQPMGAPQGPPPMSMPQPQGFPAGPPMGPMPEQAPPPPPGPQFQTYPAQPDSPAWYGPIPQPPAGPPLPPPPGLVGPGYDQGFDPGYAPGPQSPGFLYDNGGGPPQAGYAPVQDMRIQ